MSCAVEEEQCIAFEREQCLGFTQEQCLVFEQEHCPMFEQEQRIAFKTCTLFSIRVVSDLVKKGPTRAKLQNSQIQMTSLT